MRRADRVRPVRRRQPVRVLLRRMRPHSHGSRAALAALLALYQQWVMMPFVTTIVASDTLPAGHETPATPPAL